MEVRKIYTYDTMFLLLWGILIGVALGWACKEAFVLAMVVIGVQLYKADDQFFKLNVWLMFPTMTFIANYFNLPLLTNILVFYTFMRGFVRYGRTRKEDWLVYAAMMVPVCFWQAEHFQGPVLQGIVDPLCIWLLSREGAKRYLVLLLPLMFILMNYQAALYIVMWWDFGILSSFLLFLLLPRYKPQFVHYFLLFMPELFILLQWERFELLWG